MIFQTAIDYVFNPYIIKISKDCNHILYNVSLYDYVYKSDVLMGMNVCADIQYFLMLNQYTEIFEDTFELRMYKEDSFQEFERKFYSFIQKQRIGIL
jgi:hypothetical protein